MVNKQSHFDSIGRATHKTWVEWEDFLENIGAKDLDHTAIAKEVHAELEGKIANAGWWAQNVTVTYEQETGRRVVGQRADGTFEVSVSRSTQLGMHQLMDKWAAFAAKNPTVLELIDAEPRQSGTSNRLSWRVNLKDGSKVQITSEPKKDGSAAIIATIARIPSQDLTQPAKERWASILNQFLP